MWRRPVICTKGKGLIRNVSFFTIITRISVFTPNNIKLYYNLILNQPYISVSLALSGRKGRGPTIQKMIIYIYIMIMYNTIFLAGKGIQRVTFKGPVYRGFAGPKTLTVG